MTLSRWEVKLPDVDDLPARLEVGYWTCPVCGAQVKTLADADWTGYVECTVSRGCRGAMFELPGEPIRFQRQRAPT